MRFDYKNVWNNLASDLRGAKLHVVGTEDEAAFTEAMHQTLAALRETIGLNEGETYLEIGCGVGRVGRGLAPMAKRWIGCDVSSNMVAYTRERLKDLPNVEVVEISGYDLAPIADNSVDVVYCTVVFMHLDEWDRYNYVREAHRVLRPGGRFFCDNFNMLTDDGWKLFEQVRTSFPPMQRPDHISKSSTPQELENYLNRAGFREVRTRTRHLWADAWGVK